MLKTALMIVFILVSIALTVIILFQEGKSAGLGSLSGSNTETYWSKNKGRSREGVLIRATTVLVVLFFVLAAVLCIGSL
ncbi:MAG: preprotein translocase subunit SecG [Lachnospiraceae bacterium]|nr:preprotein translocase subunit SecG [Lachnospiraceae bacterium]